MSEIILKDRLTAEMQAEAWDVFETARQFGCGVRQVFNHYKQGLPSRIVNGKRITTPAAAEEYLRNRLFGQQTH